MVTSHTYLQERAEWINTFIQQLWPNVDNYVKTVIVPKVQEILEHVGIKCDRIALGRVPPRITGIKMYDKNTDRNEIIMDVDIIYASDCDAKFSFNVQSKSVICMTIKEFSLLGCLRITFKPLMEAIPFIGTVQICFLRSPEIDFIIGGEAKVLNTFGLTRIIRKTILEKIDGVIVMPNKISFPLAKREHVNKSLKNEEFLCPSPIGALKVQLHMAAELERKDFGKMLGKGKSDPYAIMSVGSHKVKSEVINNTDCPKWDDLSANFLVEVGQELMIEFFDEDPDGDDQLGQIVIPIDPIARQGNIDKSWFDLNHVKSGKALISMTWAGISYDENNAELDNINSSNKCILQLYVDSCADLVGKFKKPSPFVVINVGRKQEKKTKAQWHTTNPVFEEGFAFLVNNPFTEFIHVKVLDSNESGKDQEDLNSRLGEIGIPIHNILQQRNADSLKLQSYALKACSGTIILSGKLLNLKDGLINDEDSFCGSRTETSISDMNSFCDSINKSNLQLNYKQNDNELKESMTGEIKLSLSYVEETELKVVIHEAKDLMQVDISDPPSPYMRLNILKDKTRKKRKKTKAQKETRNPSYNRTFKVKFKMIEIY